MLLGIDLLAHDELDRLHERPWFRRYVFAQMEMDLAAGLAGDRRTEFLAGRFAGKEAVLKVLGVGLFNGVIPRDVMLLRDRSGGVEVVLVGTAAGRARAFRVGQVSVSLTHKQGWVVAVAAGWPMDSAPAPANAPLPLTLRQRQVAFLVREGLTNRQIAQRLAVAEKTVETHLSHLFTRLGVVSRVGVARALIR